MHVFILVYYVYVHFFKMDSLVRQLIIMIDINFVSEYDALSRLGIEDPRDYVSQRYCATSEVVQLESCAIGESVLKELEGAVDDIHNSEIEWIDVLVSTYVCAT